MLAFNVELPIREIENRAKCEHDASDRSSEGSLKDQTATLMGAGITALLQPAMFRAA